MTRRSPASRAGPRTDAGWRSERVEPLPADSAVTVTLGAGAPSAEGPRVTAEPQQWGFRTYGPFRVSEHECGWGRRRCSPRDHVAHPLHQPDRHEDVPRGHGPRGAPGTRSEGVRRRRHPGPPGPEEGSHELPRHPVDRDPRHVRAGPRRGRAADVRRGSGGRDPLRPRRRLRRSRPRGRWAVRRLLRQPRGAAGAGVGGGAGGLGGLARLPSVQLAQRPGHAPGPPGPGHHRRDRGRGRRARRDEPRPVTRSRGRPRSGRAGRPAGEAEEEETAARRSGPGCRPRASASTPSRTATPCSPGPPRSQDGRPLEDVEVSLVPGDTALTSAGGLARLELAKTPAPLLVARRGQDLALLPSDSSWWHERSGWERSEPSDGLRFYTFDDRRLYRPGEEVRVKGWLRQCRGRPSGRHRPTPGRGPGARTGP